MTAPFTRLDRFAMRGGFAVVSALMLFTPRLVVAQQAILTGVVRVRVSETPVANATITVEGTPLTVRSDSLGRYQLRNVPAGPQILAVRRLGYAPTRRPVNVPTSGAVTVDLTVATSALQLDQLITTADRTGRARGELGTASVIDRDAIANQIASSLQGVLELVPGVVLQPPGLDAAAQFSLRALSPSSLGGGSNTASGPSAADIAASGTLIVLDGIPLSNNANLQGVGARGEVIPSASTAGGGIDLRRIPATTLERVEVIRGIPSARWGDLTQGAIIVDTRAAATPPEFAARFDPRTTEANLVGGRGFANERQALTITGNLAETRNARTLSSASTLRGAGQVAHRLTLGRSASATAAGGDPRTSARLAVDTRLDWWQLRFDSPERIDIEPGRTSFQNDRGVRLGQRARLALGPGQLEWTAAFDRAEQLTREAQIRSRPTTPFTDRLTEGRSIGSYVEGPYSGAYALEGAPRMLYGRLEYDTRNWRWVPGHLRTGAEVRREWNAGRGYQFDIARPPQASQFNGTAGYDRPRAFAGIPALATSALYVDSRIATRRGAWFADVQAGARLETLHEGGALSGVRSSQLQPRLTAQLAPRPWVRVRGGIGVVSKSPTVSQLNPAPQYYDLVNVNRFTPNPRERLAVVTTFIRDPRNPDLGLSRARKQEIGFELDGGAKWGALTMVWFDDRIRGAATLRREPESLLRDRYALADTGIGTSQPGRILDPPIAREPVPIFIDRIVNGGRLDNRGAEFTLVLPVIASLRTRLEVNGATLESRFATTDRNFGGISGLSTFQVDTTVKRVAYFEGAASRSRRSIVTWRLVHHQPDLGLVITGTVQQRLGERRQTLLNTDSTAFAGYLGRDGVLVPVPLERRDDVAFADLRRLRSSLSSVVTTVPNDWVMTLQVAKSLPGAGRLSFYVFNVTDKFVTLGSGGTARALPNSRFGVELTLPTATWVRGRQ
jgi:hypothetical protein